MNLGYQYKVTLVTGPFTYARSGIELDRYIDDAKRIFGTENAWECISKIEIVPDRVSDSQLTENAPYRIRRI